MYKQCALKNRLADTIFALKFVVPTYSTVLGKVYTLVVSGFAEAEWLGVCVFTFTIVCGEAIIVYIALPG